MYHLYGCDPGNPDDAQSAWRSNLSPENKAKTLEILKKAKDSNQSLNTIFQITHQRTGKTQEIRAQAFIIMSPDGRPLKIWGINVDRTHEAALERENRITADFLEQTGVLAKVGGWEMDLSTAQVHMSRQT